MLRGEEGFIGGAGADHDEAAVGIIVAGFPLLDQRGDVKGLPIGIAQALGVDGCPIRAAGVVPCHIAFRPDGVSPQRIQADENILGFPPRYCQGGKLKQKY